MLYKTCENGGFQGFKYLLEDDKHTSRSFGRGSLLSCFLFNYFHRKELVLNG